MCVGFDEGMEFLEVLLLLLYEGELAFDTFSRAGTIQMKGVVCVHRILDERFFMMTNETLDKVLFVLF